MKKSDFLDNPDVNEFAGWLSDHAPNIEVNLEIRRSKFVPNRVSANLKGFSEILNCYQWKSKDVVSGDWTESVEKLKHLSEQLRDAVSSGSEQEALRACINVLDWGGDRNPHRGSRPFLERKARKQNLLTYLRGVTNALNLEEADTRLLTSESSPVKKMNSMLTKVHSLLSVDGLPIYDSRVAAAIASLVEMWRMDRKLTDKPLPDALRFPATMRSRSVLHVFPTEHHPGVLNYNSDSTSGEWASAKVRLAWLIQLVLLKTESPLFPGCADLAARMHAFEATLFMIGYDVRCLNPALGPNKRFVVPVEAKKLLNQLEESGKPTKSVGTLNGRGQSINYSGTTSTGFNVSWGSLKFTLDPETIDHLSAEFHGRSDVPLGASMTGGTPDDSLGQWLVNNGWPSARYASAIAPILLEEGELSVSSGGQRFLLSFATNC
ncbi:MAG: hypothetical protein ACK4FF_02095 [Limnobacter sp.]|uniref:hypothetical protein n=1 Tax=Limnobacter sp. TaxID=2003368 RepID=UPI00391DFC6A